MELLLAGLVLFHSGKKACAASTAFEAMAGVAFWWIPTISEGFDGLTDFSLSGVRNRSPAIDRSYSRPNSERTFARAASIDCRLAAMEKSVYGSFLKSGISHQIPAFEPHVLALYLVH